MTQLAELIQTVHRLGSATIKVGTMTKATKDFLEGVRGVYGVWLPDNSPNYVISIQAPNSKAWENCSVNLGRHNFVKNFN